jgi:hypothetical protein
MRRSGTPNLSDLLSPAQLVADQPWTAARRRQLALRFLQAKLEAPGESLQLEGAVGMWELSINRQHHADMANREALAALLARTSSPNIEVRRGGGSGCA